MGRISEGKNTLKSNGLDFPDNFFEIFGFYRCPKIKAARDAKYRAWIRTQPCAVCGRPAPSVVMHQRILQGGGTGMKPSDYETLPGCPDCHYLEGQKGFLSLWNEKSSLKFKDKEELRCFIETECRNLFETYNIPRAF